MLHTSNLRIVEIRNSFKDFKKFIGSSLLVLGFLGFAYFIYWAAAMSDETILDYTAQVFNPIATLFFPNDSSIEIYRATSFVLFSCMLPVFGLHYLADKLEEALINRERKIEKTLEENRIKQANIDNLMQYEIINNYSICLALDYESDKIIKEETRTILNNIAFSKIRKMLKMAASDINVSTGDILIVTSSNFEKYDLIYGAILRLLAKIKASFEAKYDLKVVSNIISDAYTNPETVKKIERNYKDFKSLNFKNRALSTATFLKKYKYLKHSKYGGIPIGEYATFRGRNVNSWELNIVFKNLDETLASIA